MGILVIVLTTIASPLHQLNTMMYLKVTGGQEGRWDVK